MNWLGPALNEDQTALVSMLDSLAADRGRLLDDSDQARTLVETLADLGVWTLGAPEAHGGGGADRLTTMVALERMGRYWPALGWASVQAHAAIGLLDGRREDLAAQLHTGRSAAAVVEAAAEHVALEWRAGRLTGGVARVDVAFPRPHLLVIADPGTAVLVDAGAIGATPIRSSGLDGASTSALEVNAGPDDCTRLDLVDVSAARLMLRLGAAAVAAGIAAIAVTAARTYANQRHQFGGPLTDLAAVRAGLHAQHARVATLAAIAAGGAADEHSAQAQVESSCELAIEASAAALQAHGGYGYLDEYDAGRHLRDAVSLRAVLALRPGTLAAAEHWSGRASAPHALAQELA